MPKKRILPFIILGIIHQQPQITGKGITEEFNTEIGDFWKASHSQIYPELKRMEQDEWIKVTTQPENAKERYYQITDKGQEILDNWLAQLVTEVPIHQDIFSLKLFFIDNPTDPRIRALIHQQLKLLKDELTHLEDRLNQVFPDQRSIKNSYGHYLILTRAISRTHGQIEWLQETLKSLPE